MEEKKEAEKEAKKAARKEEKKEAKREAKAKFDEHFETEAKMYGDIQKTLHETMTPDARRRAQETHRQGLGAWFTVISQTCDIEKNADDPCGDGDQSPLKDSTDLRNYASTPVQQLRNLWSEGGDFNPYNNQTSPLMKACFLGQKSVVQSIIAATINTPTDTINFVNRRESVLRMSPLLGVICGSRFMGKIEHAMGPKPLSLPGSDHVGVAEVRTPFYVCVCVCVNVCVFVCVHV
jgi:hypothetical protein